MTWYLLEPIEPGTPSPAAGFLDAVPIPSRVCRRDDLDLQAATVRALSMMQAGGDGP